MITGIVLIFMGVIKIIFERSAFSVIWTILMIVMTVMYTYNFFGKDESETNKIDSEIDSSEQENK